MKKLALAACLLASTSVFANTSLIVLPLVLNSGGGGGGAVYEKYDVSINVTEVKDTGSCRALWDDSNALRTDDLEIMFKIKNTREYFDGDESKTSKTNSVKAAQATQTPFKVVHKEYLNPEEIHIEVVDVDPLRNDSLGGFSFQFAQAYTEFDTDCVSGNIQINDSNLTEIYNDLSSKFSIGDQIIYECAGDPIIAIFKGLSQSPGQNEEYDIRVNIESLDPAQDYCSNEEGYIERIAGDGPAKEVEEIDGYMVGDIIKAPYGTGMSLAKIKKLYSAGYAEIGIYLNDSDAAAGKDTWRDEMVETRLLRR